MKWPPPAIIASASELAKPVEKVVKEVEVVDPYKVALN